MGARWAHVRMCGWREVRRVAEVDERVHEVCAPTVARCAPTPAPQTPCARSYSSPGDPWSRLTLVEVPGGVLEVYDGELEGGLGAHVQRRVGRLGRVQVHGQLVDFVAARVHEHAPGEGSAVRQRRRSPNILLETL